MSSSFVTPTILCWVFSTERTLNASLESSRNGWQSSAWNYILTRHGIEFGRFAARDRQQRGEGKPETFTFLGFTHYCGQRHKTATFTVWRTTAQKRMAAKLKAIKVELQRPMHDRVVEVGAWLQKVVSGYYLYHAVPGNIDQLYLFKHRVHRLWRSVLVRRSQTARKKWAKYGPIFDRWIPTPRILHPYPDARFYATHPS